MKQYKLTEQESRSLAWEIAHRGWTPEQQSTSDHKSDIQVFMQRYNVVMNAIDSYNSAVDES